MNDTDHPLISTQRLVRAIRRVASSVAKSEIANSKILATVTSVSPLELLTDSSLTAVPAVRITSYIPAVGDRVVCEFYGSQLVALGPVTTQFSSNYNSRALGTPSSINLANGTALPLSSGVSGVLPVANGGTGNSTGQPILQTAMSTLGSDVPLATGTWTSVLVLNAPSAGYYEITGNLEVYNSNGSSQFAEFLIGPTANSSTGAYIMGFIQLPPGGMNTKQITAFATLASGAPVYLEAYPTTSGLTCQHAPSGVYVTQLKMKRLY